MRVYAKTDIGKAREMNQDFYYVSQVNENMTLCILADGMGGYKGGEIASSLATNSSKEYIEENFDKIEHSDEEIMNLIKSAMDYANIAVYKKAKANEELEQMGTTLEICIIYNNKAYIGHIGDSRIYRIRKNIIRRITTDHSYVEKLVKEFLENDIMLMCSDGLTNMLTEETIYDIVQEQPETACENLVKRANENGGYDNISVILIKN